MGVFTQHHPSTHDRRMRMNNAQLLQTSTGGINQTRKLHDDDKVDISQFLFMGDDDGEKVSRLNTCNALWYALTLEPVEVQNMRCGELVSNLFSISNLFH